MSKFNDVPEIVPIKNSKKSIKDLKLEKIFKVKRKKDFNRIINIIFIIILLILFMITTDIILVGKYNKKGIFVIPIHTYKDGGSKEYLGFGYKIIDYNQVQGRRDIEIGFLNMKYYTEPTMVSDYALAIEFENNSREAIKNYYKRFVRVSGKVKVVDLKRNQLILAFEDDGDKYALNIICNMASNNNHLKSYTEGDLVNVIGTIVRFEDNKVDIPNTLYIDNVFSEKQ